MISCYVLDLGTEATVEHVLGQALNEAGGDVHVVLEQLLELEAEQEL